MHMYIHLQMNTCMYMCIYMCMSMCMDMQMHMCMCTHSHTNMYTFVCVVLSTLAATVFPPHDWGFSRPLPLRPTQILTIYFPASSLGVPSSLRTACALVVVVSL